VVVGATLFGFLGVPIRFFYNEYGLGSIDSVMVRLTFASIFLLVIIGVLAHDKLKIHKQDIPVLLLFGVFKLMSDLTFFYAQNTIQISMATLLQMTAPYFVMLISLILFREKLTAKKVISMVIASIGAILITGVLFGSIKIEYAGAISALMSGLFFGLFMVGSKVFNDKGIHPAASLFYTMLFADLMILPFVNYSGLAEAMTDFEGLVMCICLGVMMTLVPYYLYSWSTQFIEPTLTSMISVLELVAATMVGLIFFSEGVSIPNLIGIILVIGAVIFMNLKFHSDYTKKYGKYIPKRFTQPLFSKKDNG
jgi:drug/metabolite transporter (DMT)-like permease